MAYCPSCGVELAADLKRCPLCGAAPVLELSAETRRERAAESLRATPRPAAPAAAAGGEEPLPPAEATTLLWEILSVSILIAAAAVAGVNLLTEGRLHWSLYALFSLALVWILVTVLAQLRKPAFLAPLIVGLAIPAYLLALDLIDGRIDWALHLGLPITLIAEASAALAWLASSRAAIKGPNIAAFALLAATLSCIGVDTALSLYYKGVIALSWSGVVACSAVPVAAFLLYLHHRLRRVSRLRRLFRL